MTRLRQPIRALLALSNGLVRLGLAPSPIQQVTEPVVKRQLSKPPAWMTRPGDRTIRTREHELDGRCGPITVRVYVRPGTQPGSPVIVYLHGGGFVLGGLDGCDYITRGLAARTGFPVVSVEYRLAPDCPFPGPLEDCQDALQWVVDTRPEGIDPTRIALGGDSAGGNLTAALALLIRDSGGPEIRHQTLVYPFTDGTLSSTDWDTRAMGGVDRSAGQQMMAWYAPNHPADEPLVSVLHADHAGLPTALVITAEHDVLRSDGLRYAQALRNAGVSVVERDFEGLPHGFLSMPRLTKDADRCLDLIAQEMCAALTGTSPRSRRGTPPAAPRASAL
jgi:acetyl esterase